MIEKCITHNNNERETLNKCTPICGKAQSNFEEGDPMGLVKMEQIRRMELLPPGRE